MSTRSPAELGRILSALHWQCWRETPPPLEVEPADLIAVLPSLIRSGSVGLVWPRLQGQLDRYGAIALALEESVRAQVAHNETCQREIASAVTRLRAANIEPLLVKGWSVSCRYPAGVVRPAGDIDLVVPHADFAQADAILTGPGADPLTVGLDLKHPAIWEERPNEDFWNRTGKLDVCGVSVQILAPEDELRMLCFHFLKHGGMRPLWLADIALALESRPAEFDWARVLGSDRVERSWVVAALGVAHRLFGATVTETPPADDARKLPGWIIPTVFNQWQTTRPAPTGVTTQLLANPRNVLRIISSRWQDPITATIYMRFPATSFPRFPVQVLELGRRLKNHIRYQMVKQLMGSIRNQP